MASLSLEEQLRKAADEEERANELERLKQEQRKKNLDRVHKLARAGQVAAALSGNEELYNLLGEGANAAKRNAEGEQEPGAIRNTASNVGGKMAGKLAGEGVKVPFRNKKLAEGAGLGRGQAAAIGGAVAGALEGEGAVGIAKSAISWWVLDLVFGSLFTIVGFIPALLYLDFHYIMSKLGSKVFGRMTMWQKLLLLVANLVAALIPLAFVLLVYTATCGNTLGSVASKAIHYGSLGYVQDFCKAFGGGGQSGGAGGGGTFTGLLADIPPQYWNAGNFGDAKFDYPRVKQELLDKIEQVFAAAKSQGLNLLVTSGLRKQGGPFSYTCHMLGEAADLALVNPVAAKSEGGGVSDPRIDKLLTIINQVGFGTVLDEYRHSIEGRTTGGHIHVNLGSDPNCVGRQSEIPPDSEFHMPQ